MPRRPALPGSAGAALLLLALAAGCADPASPPPAAAAQSGGVRAIEGDRAQIDEDVGEPGNNPGSWGGVQAPDISTAPRLQLPRLP